MLQPKLKFRKGGGQGCSPAHLQLYAEGVTLDGLVHTPCLPQGVAQVVVGLWEVGLMRKRLSVCGYCAIQLPLLEEYPCICTQSLRRASSEHSRAQV